MADDPALAHAFEVQAGHCTRMNAPFNARVCMLLRHILDGSSALGRRVLAWPRTNLAGDLIPLRCCAGFHALARAKRVPSLADCYPPHDSDGAALEAGLREAIAQHDDFLAAYLESAPQTNEIGRSAILLGGLLAIAARVKQPLALFEVGASAGLNMQFDKWRYELGEGKQWDGPDARVRLHCEWTGAAPSVDTRLKVASRAASDLSPLDAGKPSDRDRLLSYIWPDQAERLERTMAALAVAASSGLTIEKADALDWLARRVSPDSVADGTTTVLWHSVFIQYLDPAARRVLIEAIRERGSQATAEKPCAWLQMEAGLQTHEQCELRLTLWPGGAMERLATVDWHGRAAQWL